MSKIYITRHGETEWNKVRRMQGQQDSPLSSLGVKQATWLSNKLKNVNIDIIYSSSLKRAIHTANIIRNERPIDIIPSDELKEIYLGNWEGKLMSEVEKEYPIHFNHFWKSPEHYEPIDGESFQDLTNRVNNFFETIIHKHKDKNILIVGHAIVLKGLINAKLNNGDVAKFWDSPMLYPTSLTIADVNDNNIKFEIIGDTSHYKEENVKGKWFIDK